METDQLVDRIVARSRALPSNMVGRASALFALGMVKAAADEAGQRWVTDVDLVREAWSGRMHPFERAIDEVLKRHLTIRDGYREGSEDARYWASLLMAASCTQLGDLSDDSVDMLVSAGHALGLSCQQIWGTFEEVMGEIVTK